MSEIVVDNFAGGGGASTGIARALGRIDIAINHDPEAVAVHAANHPETRHYCQDVWSVDPIEACEGRPVGLAWFSPDCKHFSRAKGGVPRNQNVRALSWVVTRWAKAVRPRVICLENVEELLTWGPLVDGMPDKTRAGKTFGAWKAKLESYGYHVEHRTLVAADYGAPTTRKRLYLVARCDGLPIEWPSATHTKAEWVPASTCIDWSLPVPSIFGRARPLKAATLRRIARGLERFALSGSPLVVGDAAITMVQTGYGEREGQAPRSLDIRRPLGTIVAGGAKHALVYAFLAKHYGGHEGPGSSLLSPLSTITTQDHHALVTATAGEHSPEVRDFLATHGTARQLGFGSGLAIADIGMRMLQPRELFNAQGFPRDYDIDPAIARRLTKTAQIRLAGNSVCPDVAHALVAANVGSVNARAA